MHHTFYESLELETAVLLQSLPGNCRAGSLLRGPQGTALCGIRQPPAGMYETITTYEKNTVCVGVVAPS
jgi:hypothetical protein